MPRGRPRKVVASAIIEQPKKPIESPKKDTMTIFSEALTNDISEPVAGPVAEAIIDESTQNSDTSQNVGSTAQVLWDKCLRELEAYDAARSAIQKRIGNAEAQTELLQAEAYAATQSHTQARAALGDIKRQVAIQAKRVELCEGTPAEKDARRELIRLQADLAQAQEAVDESVETLHRTQERLQHVSALQEAIDADTEEIAKIDGQAALMETLLQEQKAVRGQEIYDEVKHAIETIEQEIYDREHDVSIAEGWKKEAQDAIPSMLREWPELVDRLLDSHGETLKPIGETSTAKVIRAWIEFVKVLGQEQGKVDSKVSGGTVFLIDFLELPRGLIAQLLSGEKWFRKVTRDTRGRETVEDTTRELEVAEVLLREQADKQRGNYKPTAW